MSTPSSRNWTPRGCLPAAERWIARARTLEALSLLVLARLLIALVPLRRWRSTLGADAGDGPYPAAKVLAAHVRRAAGRLPFATKCLPQAMALSWMLRRRHIAHCVVIGVRQPGAISEDQLHAWVEVAGQDILDARNSDWSEILRLGQ